MAEEHIFTEDNEGVDKDSLWKLSCEAQRLLSLKDTLKQNIEEVKKTEKIIEAISREVIPNLMTSVGLSSFTLNTGETIEVKEKIFPNITKNNKTVAYRNMVNAEGEDEEAEKRIRALFKSKIILDDLDEDSEEQVLDLLMEHNLPYNLDMNIHPQTLKKYCRERLEKGLSIPEGISVFQYPEATVTQEK